MSDIRAAHERIRPLIHRTPVMTCATLDAMCGRRLFFKCENLQRVGAFKFRGACNAVLSLSDAEAVRGVCTHSSGNHAQALARAARERGIHAWIVMPSTASSIKRLAVEGYGGTVIECEPTLEARETTAAAVMADTGATFIHPYDDPRIIAGQATTAIELIEQVDDLDAIVTPIGGGGLMSGTCLSASAIKPGIRLIGAEPAGADDAARSLASGTLIPQTAPDTICDGLLTSLSDLTWSILSTHLETILRVRDEQVLAAMQLLWERAKCVVEPSSAIVLAAVLSDECPLPPDCRIGLILTGGNVLWPVGPVNPARSGGV
jgi:threonine dehydratase